MHVGRLLAASSLLATPAAAADYAILVAGSNGYDNYRHQADVCHAYQILTKGGVPADNIITMMYDDIAHSRENRKFKGKIYNKATARGETPVDVYAGVKIDYKGKSVNPSTFLKVLTGNSTGLGELGSGRVLQSGPQDNLFINFVDHGAPGLIAFPDGELHSKQLIRALKKMHSEGKYKQMAFYLEACDSGSMFKKLPKGLNIYATTASNAKESSWATYCAPKHDLVGGKHTGTCLADLYSANWMENADGKDLTQETLQQQYTTVKQETIKGEEGGSHVMQFGDLSIATQDASAFQGKGDVGPMSERGAAADSGIVDSRDVALVNRFSAYMSASEEERSAAAAALVAEVTAREEADSRFRRIAAAAGAPEAFTAAPAFDTSESEDCHIDAVAETRRLCGWTDYSLKYAGTIGSLCDRRSTGEVLRAVRSVCPAK